MTAPRRAAPPVSIQLASGAASRVGEAIARLARAPYLAARARNGMTQTHIHTETLIWEQFSPASEPAWAEREARPGVDLRSAADGEENNITPRKMAESS